MTFFRKILLAGACAGLFAFSAAPVLAAGPMMPKAKDGGAVQKAEYRYDYRTGRYVWVEPPRYYSPYYGPRYGGDYWGDRDDNPPGPRGGPGTNWENPPGPRGGPGASPDRRYPSYWYAPIY
jgi:hypothetical protein